MMMAMKVLSVAAAAAVTDWSRKEQSSESAGVKMLDTLFAEGIRKADCFAPKGGSEFYSALKGAVIAGFSKDKQALLAADVKSLSDAKKAAKQKAGMAIGAYLGEIRAGLERREKAEAKAAAEAAIREKAAKAGKDPNEAVAKAKAAAKARWEDKARKTLATLIDQASSREGLVINDQSKFIAELKSAMVRLK
jgi:hypothetical protein